MPDPTTVFLVRHGQTDWIAKGIAGRLGIRTAHPGGAVAVFSHGDVIRSAVAYFAGVPLDLFLRLEIRPASISSVRFYDDALQILGVNDTGELYA